MLLVLFLVLLNGFFVAAEFALVKVRISRLQQLQNEGNTRAKYALAVTKKLDAYLSATQLGITLASLGLGWVGEPAVAHLIVDPTLALFHMENAVFSKPLSFGVSFAVITFLHIVLGELAPKSLAIQKSEQTSLWLAAPLLFFYKVFRPAIWLLNGAANRVLRWLGIAMASEKEAAHTEEEIRLLMDESARSGIIDKDEMALFDNVFEFSDRLAREVMLPRTDMDCLFIEWNWEDNMELVYKTKHTRYPVALSDKDNIVGFVHITDLLTADPDEPHELKDFLRPILTVPESMEVSKVLKLMQKRHSQLAIVIDEYGGTAGLLTTEEILEEIVGELHDEFDEDERPPIEVNGDITTVDGRMLLEDINDLMHLDLEDDEVDSIGGWLFTKLEGTPAKGKKAAHGSYIFEVAEVKRLRILRVSIYRKDLQHTAEKLEESSPKVR
ncbi:hemolysin family protein [Paenibacillus hamazuiensis]|uniref:hemolysin family protein n=1 Tax=Paenibacillus hamazuiensis TaxID=2936508 RepID=UPI00200DB7EB|nr:hemolysin family protein [Paenibacillus hamazuiensis]